MADTKLSQLTLKTGDMVASDLVEITEGGNTTKSVTGTKILGFVSANITGITTSQADAIVANTAKTGITSEQASAITANTAKTGITSEQANAITANTAKVTNATHSGEVTGATALTIADNVVDEANLKVSNTPTNGYALTAQSGNTGGLTWAETAAAAGSSSIVTTGALNSGSITSGFGSINNGASAITTTGALGAGTATFGGNVSIPSGSLLLLDGSSDTYIREKSANEMQFVTGGAGALTLDASQKATFAGDVSIGSSDGTRPLYIVDGTSTGQSQNASANLVLDDKAANLIEFLADDGEASIHGLYFSDSTAGRGRLVYTHSTDTMTFRAGGQDELTLTNTEATFAGDVAISGAGQSNVGGAGSEYSSGSKLHVKAESSGDVRCVTLSRTGQSAEYSTLINADKLYLQSKTGGTETNILDISATGDATFAGDVIINAAVAQRSGFSNELQISGGAPTISLSDSGYSTHNHFISVDRQFFAIGRMDNGTGANPAEYLQFDATSNKATFAGNIIRKATPNGSVGGLAITDNGTGPLVSIGDTGTTLNTLYDFYNGNGIVGKIQTNGSGTAFVTSSDYRLKENVVTDWDATTRLKQLKPSRFNFIADADTTVDGFLAHEAQAVVPECATGLKDAMKDEEYEVSAATGEVFTPAIEEVTTQSQVMETVETGSYVNLAGETIVETAEQGVTTETTETVVQRQDIDGVSTEVEVEVTTQVPTMETVITTAAVAEIVHSTDVVQPDTLADGQQWRETTARVMATRSVPDYQGIDQSKLVPLLVKTIQELEARITALEA